MKTGNLFIKTCNLEGRGKKKCEIKNIKSEMFFVDNLLSSNTMFGLVDA